ncbi:putative protein [Arabidopsis thaliana]|uniref:At3g52110 n=2 Tax=Arabidopsis thaliana TaxID=3702 RepID=Q9SUZ4_ARATH|nr:interferon-activable protein [Arabidopsis thaliana]AAU94371.1 At3g52110 [Arabidopsis thaliana]AAV59283.1 At3g52110 [Arabidopsis thaliana]AEE78893.1 interferon-activable protein [Arabidopsis thaliana]CAB41331.1 putative protein [Arabidopsis thaliana]|eukprot:NP_190779.3 interferon-activable protein [Arabidopsis thaliana]
MEPAHIDWKRIDSRFVEDVFYEHIRAPKWFDFLAPTHFDSIDDDAWFCKPECNHPKRPEDFFSTPTSSKHPSLRDTNETLTEQNQRRRGYALSPSTPNNQESENQNPNLATPPSYQAKSWRAAIKSTSVKKMNKEVPRLKSTQSARNLFSGRDIFGHISDFCYELKRLATRVTEREDTGKSEVKESHQVGEIVNQPYSVHDLELKKERKPLLEVSKDKLPESTDVKGSTFKENRRRKKRVDDAENIPVSLNVETVKNKGEEGRRKKRMDDAENIPVPLKLETIKNKGHERFLQQIRTNPPSPQCFSENRTATLKPLRTKPTEVLKRKEDEAEEEKNRKSGESKEATRGLDVLWFLKPCTLAN